MVANPDRLHRSHPVIYGVIMVTSLFFVSHRASCSLVSSDQATDASNPFRRPIPYHSFSTFHILQEAVVVASRGLTIDDSNYGEGIVDRDRELPPPTNTEEQLVRATSRHGSFIHSTTTSEQRADDAEQQHQHQHQHQRRRRRLRNGGGGIISASVAATSTSTSTTTALAFSNSNTRASDAADTMTLPPPFSRRRPSRRSSMPSSFGSSGGGVSAFLQRQQQQQQPSVYDMGMPPPMSREAKRRKSINATSTSPTEAADFGLDLDLDQSSGRSTPLRSNSSGLASSANRTATTANPFAVDLDLDASADVLAEDLLRRTCLPVPGQIGFAEHMAGLYLAAAAPPSSSSSSPPRRSIARRMSLPSPQDMRGGAAYRAAQMTGGGGGPPAAAAAPESNREMMQLLRAQHRQLQLQWQAKVQAQAQVQQEGTTTTTTGHRRQERRSELSTSSGGSSSAATNFSLQGSAATAPSPTSSSRRGSRAPPPFAFKYSLSDRSLGGTTAAAEADAIASATTNTTTEGGLQRFKKRPSESIYFNSADSRNQDVEMAADDDEEEEVCIEIHSTTSNNQDASARLTTGRPASGTSGASSSSHPVSPPCSHEDDSESMAHRAEAVNGAIKAPAIRFFNNGVEVNEAGVPIVSPAVPAKPFFQGKAVPIPSRATCSTSDAPNERVNAPAAAIGAYSSITKANTNNSSPVPTATDDQQSSLSPPLSRSCSVADVISFAVKRVPELTQRMAPNDDGDTADPTKIDDVLQALYAIAGDAKGGEASPKVPATDAEAQRARQTELFQTRVSTTIRSVEGYRRQGKATGADGRTAATRADADASARTSSVVGPHADLIHQIFGGGHPPSLEEASGSESTLDASSSSLDDMVQDSFQQREKHVDAAAALLAISTSGDGGKRQ